MLSPDDQSLSVRTRTVMSFPPTQLPSLRTVQGQLVINNSTFKLGWLLALVSKALNVGLLIKFNARAHIYTHYLLESLWKHFCHI